MDVTEDKLEEIMNSLEIFQAENKTLKRKVGIQRTVRTVSNYFLLSQQPESCRTKSEDLAICILRTQSVNIIYFVYFVYPRRKETNYDKKISGEKKLYYDKKFLVGIKRFKVFIIVLMVSKSTWVERKLRGK